MATTSSSATKGTPANEVKSNHNFDLQLETLRRELQSTYNGDPLKGQLNKALALIIEQNNTIHSLTEKIATVHSAQAISSYDLVADPSVFSGDGGYNLGLEWFIKLQMKLSSMSTSTQEEKI
ncbi:hypothetical protein LTR66_014875, partial [Elasticomyces elasticus]